MTMVFIALVNPDDPYPIAFEGSGTKDAFLNAWERSVASASEEFGSEYSFKDVAKNMKKFGYTPIKSEWIYGE